MHPQKPNQQTLAVLVLSSLLCFWVTKAVSSPLYEWGLMQINCEKQKENMDFFVTLYRQ